MVDSIGNAGTTGAVISAGNSLDRQAEPTQISNTSRQKAANGDPGLSAESQAAIRNGALPPQVQQQSSPAENSNAQQQTTESQTLDAIAAAVQDNLDVSPEAQQLIAAAEQGLANDASPQIAEANLQAAQSDFEFTGEQAVAEPAVQTTQPSSAPAQTQTVDTAQQSNQQAGAQSDVLNLDIQA